MFTPIYIAITIDESYFQHAGVMLSSLFESNPNQKFHIYLFTESIKNHNYKKLEGFISQYKQQLEWIAVSKQKVGHLVTNAHATTAVYYRLLIPELLDTKIKKILYLDCDLLVQKTIVDLWETNTNNHCLAAVKDLLYEEDNYLHLPDGIAYFNSGVMLINLDKWREKKVTQKAIQFLEENPDIIRFWDQDALNVVLLGEWTSLPEIWNVSSTYYSINREDIIKQAAIIHFTGTHKPWSSHCEHPKKGEYFKYIRNTPWKKFRLPEQTNWHFLKQKLKKGLNSLLHKQVFDIYTH